jgi:predicted transcriptional regulator
MLSFRVDDGDAAAIQRWADELGVDRSALLRDAVRKHLNRLAA